nr:hypothetical protein [Tanacetum cinerariifolium]
MTAGMLRQYTFGPSGTLGKQMVIVCYNCKGEGHMSKQFTKPKRKRDEAWFKDKVLLVQAQANGQRLSYGVPVRHCSYPFGPWHSVIGNDGYLRRYPYNVDFFLKGSSVILPLFRVALLVTDHFVNTVTFIVSLFCRFLIVRLVPVRPFFLPHSKLHYSHGMSWLVQKQTALGKDNSNPLRVDSLLKAIWSSIHHHLTNEVLTIPGQTATEGVDCLPNKEIFAELARMGYEKPSTKLTFYKAFFSSQWKFLIYIILQSMSAKRTSWNEFSSVMASAVICLSTGVETPLFEGMIVEQVIEEGGAEEEHPQPQPQPQAQQQAADFPMSLLQEALDACTALTRRVEHLEYDKVAQALEITKLKKRVKNLEKGNRVKVLKLRRLKKVETSQRIDTSEENVMDDASNQGRMIDEVVTAVSETVDAASTIISVAEPQVPVATITAAPVRVVAISTRRRKGVVIRDPEEESSTVIPADTKSKDKGKGIMQKVKEDPAVQRYQVIKKMPQTEAQARKNIIMYLKNIAGFTLDYFKGMSYDHIRLIFKAKFNSNIEFLLKTKEQMEEEESRALQSINETPAQKAAKRRKLNEEVKDLKRHLEIVHDEDDDVYTEPLHLQEREELESLWSLVKERFSTSKPKNFFDDFLLTTLGAMFERPDGQAQVWNN